MKDLDQEPVDDRHGVESGIAARRDRRPCTRNGSIEDQAAEPHLGGVA